MISLAGKVATEMRFSGIAGGCSKDFRETVGAITEGLMYNATRGFSFQDYRLPTSPSYDLRMESAVNAELERYTIEVRDILLKNTRLLDRVTEELMQKQYLLFSDIQRIKAECGLVKTEVVC